MTLQLLEPQTKRWTREEYYRLAEDGWFRNQRVQLIEGEIVQMPPQGHEHARAIIALSRWLFDISGNEYVVRCQMPLNALKNSDPEPDLALIPGPLEALKDHPSTSFLVIEVSDSSLRLDRRKASLYAAANVLEYWIVNLVDRCVEIYRQPQPNQKAEFGFDYADRTIRKEHESISPIAIPQASIKIAAIIG